MNDVKHVDKKLLEVKYTDKKTMEWFCKNHHYSRSVPVGKLIKHVVIYNNEVFGVIIYGRGANPNLAKRFNLTQYESCELVRIALKPHKDFFVSEALAKSLKMLKEEETNMKLIVSFADIAQGHSGQIYKATNWIYEKISDPSIKVYIQGVAVHNKTISENIKSMQNLDIPRVEKIKIYYKTNDVVISKDQGKHSYLFFLDKKERKKYLKNNRKV